MGCVIAKPACPPVPCLPREAAECAALEADFLAQLSLDASATVLRSQMVRKLSSCAGGDGPTKRGVLRLPDALSKDQSGRRFVVLRQRGPLGCWLEFLDVIPDPALQQPTGALPLENASVSRVNGSVTIIVSSYVHPQSAFADRAFGFSCGSEGDASTWEREMTTAMRAADAKSWGVSAGVLRAEWSLWRGEAQPPASSAVHPGVWCRVAWGGLSVRKEIALDSEEHGVLRLGDEVLVEEKQLLERGDSFDKPMIVRVRVSTATTGDLGWVTAEQADGRQLLQPRGQMLYDYADSLAARLAKMRDDPVRPLLETSCYMDTLAAAAAAAAGDGSISWPIPEADTGEMDRNGERKVKWMNFVLKTMHFALKTMNYVLNMINFVFKTMNYVLNMINFVFKTMNYVLNMMNWTKRPRGAAFGSWRGHCISKPFVANDDCRFL